MVFEPEKFTTLGAQLKGGISYQTFGYLGTVDDELTISAAGYFNETKTSLRVNDTIQVLGRTEFDAGYYNLRVRKIPLNGDVTTEKIQLESILLKRYVLLLSGQ